MNTQIHTHTHVSFFSRIFLTKAKTATATQGLLGREPSVSTFFLSFSGHSKRKAQPQQQQRRRRGEEKSKGNPNLGATVWRLQHTHTHTHTYTHAHTCTKRANDFS